MRWADDPDDAPAQHPKGMLLTEARVVEVVEGDVLQVAGHSVQPQPALGVGVVGANPPMAGEHPALGGQRS